MNFVFYYTISFVLVSVFGLPEITSKGNKIKIVVPQKIKYVHHHHHPRSKPSDIKFKMKYFYEPDYSEYDDEEMEEDDDGVVNESRIRSFGEFEGSRRGIPYYDVPTSRFTSSAANIKMKPVFVYNNYNKYNHPSTTAVVKYSGYDEYDDGFYINSDYDYK